MQDEPEGRVGPKRAEADRGNFGSLLRGMVGSRLGAEMGGSWWETGKGLEEVQEVWKRSGRAWESAEEVGRHGKVTVRYTASLLNKFLL